MIKIYLAGAMSGLSFEESNEWRIKFREDFKKAVGYSQYKIINPNDYYNFKELKHKSEKEIKEFDLHMVRTSDLIVVNLDNINKSIGTAMELHEAKMRNTPIIALGKEENVHPWISDCLWRTEENMNDLINYIIDYFL